MAMSTDKFFIYYLAAIGNPYLNYKIKILKHNLCFIFNNIKKPYDIVINCYDDCTLLIETMLNSLSFIRNIFIHNKKGILVELWHTNPHDDILKNYENIFFILDDVKIINVDIINLILIKKTFNISFLSPKVIGGTWDYMRKYNNNVIGFANNIEIFCLLFYYNDFMKFMSINDIDNPWIWGVDLLLGYHNIKSAVYYKFCVKHMLPSNSNHGIAGGQMARYINKRGFKSVNDVNAKYKPIYKIIQYPPPSPSLPPSKKKSNIKKKRFYKMILK